MIRQTIHQHSRLRVTTPHIIYNAGAGSVTVTVTDSSCTATAPSATQPDSFAGSITGDQVLCTGRSRYYIGGRCPDRRTAPFDYRTVAAIQQPNRYLYKHSQRYRAGYDPNPVNGANTTLYYRRMLTSGSCPPVTNTAGARTEADARLRGGGSICPGDTAFFVEMLAVWVRYC